jgi:hypothetical protein
MADQTARRARAALAYGAIAYLTLQVAGTALLETRCPGVYDPEYDARLTVLKARLAEDPARPLVLVTGSSRLMFAFHPESLPPLPTASGSPLLTFNACHPGAGPVMQLMHVRRLLREGIRPNWLAVEVMPAYLAHEGRTFLAASVTARDLPLLVHYYSPWKMLGSYLYQRTAAGRWQAEVTRRLAPGCVPPDGCGPEAIGPLGGWLGLRTSVTPEERRNQTALAESQYRHRLQAHRIAPAADRAVRDLLDLCRRERISVVLVRSPESGLFRDWYTPGASESVDRYLNGLAGEYGAAVIDAQRWLADEDFYDGHHALHRGAATFTHRFEHEVLRPLAAGRLTPSAASVARR